MNDTEKTNTNTVEDEGMAMSILSDYKKNTKRWFIAFMCVLILWISTIFIIVGAVTYVVSNYDIGSYEVQQDSEGDSYSVIDSEAVEFGPKN